MRDGRPWPSVTIVTPSFNQGGYLEETIRSVLLQGYPNLEYIIMDGGSADHSLDIIRKYQAYLAFWISDKDRGQSDALLRGFARATGEVMGWLNSDDSLAPEALETAMSAWRCHAEPAIVTGQVVRFSDRTAEYTVDKPHFNSFFLHRPWRLRGDGFQQPGSFFRRDVYVKAGGIDCNLHSVMDYDLYARILAIEDRIVHVSQVLAYFRCHRGSKTMGDGRADLRHLLEHFRVTARYVSSLSPGERHRLKQYYSERAWYGLFEGVLHRNLRYALNCLRFGGRLGITASGLGLGRLLVRGVRKTLAGEKITMLARKRGRRI